MVKTESRLLQISPWPASILAAAPPFFKVAFSTNQCNRIVLTRQPPKLLDLVKNAIRRKHYSYRTEHTYLGWVKCYIHFHKERTGQYIHPRHMGATEIEAFLTHLAVDQNVAASTQNQARSALLFLYDEVLHQPIAEPLRPTQAKKPQRLPVVFTKEEVQAVFSKMSGPHLLMAQLLYGSGLRLMECVRLRVKDLDFVQRRIIVRDG